MNNPKLEVIYQKLKEAQERWCKDDIDEQMWVEIPELLDEIVPMMKDALEK